MIYLIKPKVFRVIKPEIRVLGIDDGKFIPHTQRKAVVIGVVFRGGRSLDGVMHTTIAIDGLDATEKLTAMINGSPHKNQLRLVMLNGMTFGGFNLVDIRKLYINTGLPVITITQYKTNLDDMHDALKHLSDTELRWQIVLNAGIIHEVTNKGVKLYIGIVGITLKDSLSVLDATSTRSSLPEPLRVAHLIASGITC